MKESSQEVVELKDTNLPAFQHLLRYIYTGSITLASLKEDLILDILGLAHQYGFQVECRGLKLCWPKTDYVLLFGRTWRWPSPTT